LIQLACVSIVQVHERTLQGDFLMALLRDLVISRRTAGNPLKVFLPCHASLYLMRQTVLL
jgi:HrpA-like RNA helicase